MSQLEELVRAALRAGLPAGTLATWSGQPAVFVVSAPSDRSAGWAGAQYPRIVLSIDRRWGGGSPQDGTLSLTVEAPDPAPIERLAAAILDGAYWHPTAEPDAVTRRVGAALDPVVLDTGELLASLTATYDVVSYEARPALDPDPAEALTDFTEGAFPALQSDPAIWSATDANPAIFWRIVPPWTLAGIRTPDHQAWQATLRCHVIHPSAAVRLEWAQRIARAVVQARRVALGASRLRVQPPVEIDPRADPLRDGQLTLRALFSAVEVYPVPELIETVQMADPADHTLLEVPAGV